MNRLDTCIVAELFTALCIFLVACGAPSDARTGNASKVVASVSPTVTIQAPVSFLGQYKIYNFDPNTDFGFNQKWFFQAKSGGTSANPNDFPGRLCFSASETRWVIRDWGQSAKGEWIAFEDVGIGTQERVAPVPTHPPIFGVEQKYWTNIWSCDCSMKRDLRITNGYDFPVCLS